MGIVIGMRPMNEMICTLRTEAHHHIGDCHFKPVWRRSLMNRNPLKGISAIECNRREGYLFGDKKWTCQRNIPESRITFNSYLYSIIGYFWIQNDLGNVLFLPTGEISYNLKIAFSWFVAIKKLALLGDIALILYRKAHQK